MIVEPRRPCDSAGRAVVKGLKLLLNADISYGSELYCWEKLPCGKEGFCCGVVLEAERGVRAWVGEADAVGTVGIDILRESLLTMGLFETVESSCGVAIDADR